MRKLSWVTVVCRFWKISKIPEGLLFGAPYILLLGPISLFLSGYYCHSELRFSLPATLATYVIIWCGLHSSGKKETCRFHISMLYIFDTCPRVLGLLAGGYCIAQRHAVGLWVCLSVCPVFRSSRLVASRFDGLTNTHCGFSCLLCFFRISSFCP